MTIHHALNNVACKNATAGGRKIKKLHDGGGLYLWVYANGCKYWRLRYKMRDKEKSMSLGVYPQVGLKEAREEADKQRKKIKDGIDPSIARKIEKQQHDDDARNSFEAVAMEWHSKQTNIWSEKYAGDVLCRLKKNVFPYLGNVPIREITARQLLNTIHIIEQRGSYDQAHRVSQVCSQVFLYGIQTDRCLNNPAADLKGGLTPHKKENYKAVTQEELPKLIKDIANYHKIGNKQTQLALQLMTLTFVRTSELIGAPWSEFDLENAIWIVPAERMKMESEHVVPLCTQALDIIKELKQIAGNSHYLLPGRNPNKPLSNNTLLSALYRMNYKGKMTGHGFRHVASTAFNEVGFRADAIERQLSHCERNSVRGAYNKAEYFPERKEMMQWWGDYIEGLLKGADVVPLFKKAN